MSGPNGRAAPGRLTPLRSDRRPGDRDLGVGVRRAGLDHAQAHAPVVEQKVEPRLERGEHLRVGQRDPLGHRPARGRYRGGSGRPASSVAEPPAKAPMRSFGPCRSATTAMRMGGVGLDRAHGGVERGDARMVAVAEVEAEGVRPRLVEGGDALAGRRRRTEGGEDPGAPLAGLRVHGVTAEAAPAAAAGGATRTARKSLTLVSVGPVTTRSPTAAKKP